MRCHLKCFRMVIACIVLSIFACVTINIYFPAEKVESVAGEIVNEIRGQDSQKTEESFKDDKSSLLEKTLVALSPAFVWAGEVTKVSNPTIRALKQKMKNRYNRMKPYYQRTVLIEGEDGYVSLEKKKGLGLKVQRDLKNLVEAENKDRKRLYEEIAKALKIDLSQINRIEKIFAREWQKSVR